MGALGSQKNLYHPKVRPAAVCSLSAHRSTVCVLTRQHACGCIADAKHMSARQLEQRLPQDLAKIHQLYEK
jgi:hypothetical protein